MISPNSQPRNSASTEVTTLFAMLDVDGSGSLGIDEFVNGATGHECLRMKFHEDQWSFGSSVLKSQLCAC